MPQVNNNQYATLAGEEGNEENDTKSIGVENDGKITGARHDEEFTEVDSNNRARNREVREQLTKRMQWNSLKRP